MHMRTLLMLLLMLRIAEIMAGFRQGGAYRIEKRMDKHDFKHFDGDAYIFITE